MNALGAGLRGWLREFPGGSAAVLAVKAVSGAISK